MRTVAIALGMLLLQGEFDRENNIDAAPDRFSIERKLGLPANARGQACAVVDAAIYAHTDGRLSALRVYRMNGSTVAGEIPFALTESGEAGQQAEPARVLNLGKQGKTIVFDLAMPQRAYTAVTLDLHGHDFYAEAKVSGSDGRGGAATQLGVFALFDLQTQRLSRSTTLPLQEVSFPILHVELSVMAAPGATTAFTPEMVAGAQVPPSRDAQMLYTPVVSSSEFTIRGHNTVAVLLAPAHVPIEHAEFLLRDDFTKNFSREVRLTTYAGALRGEPVAPRDSYADEIISGTIQRVNLARSIGGVPIRNEQTSVEAVLGANLRADSTVEVAVANGDDAPLPLRAIVLEMRQRRICFDAEPGASYVLRYGDVSAVRAPVYDYARLFEASENVIQASLDPEAANPDLKSDAQRSDRRSYAERHPELLWVVLLVVISVLGKIAVRSAKRAGKH